MLASERAEQARVELQRANALRTADFVDGFVVISGVVLGAYKKLAQIDLSSRVSIVDLRNGDGAILQLTPYLGEPPEAHAARVRNALLEWLLQPEGRMCGPTPADGLRRLRERAARHGRLPELDYAGTD